MNGSRSVRPSSGQCVVAIVVAVVTVVSSCAPVAPGAVTEAPAPEPETVTPEPPVGRAAAEAAEFAPLDFQPPRADRFELSNGIVVFYLEDRSLPLVEFVASFEGGPVRFERGHFAAAHAVGPLILSGGTASLPPDSVAERIERYALAPSVTTGGSRSAARISTLTRHLEHALGLWAEMLRAPRFDSERVELWRQRELSAVRRSQEEPGTVAIREFNRLMYGDHPVGWIMDERDLDPELLSADRLHEVHQAIYCPDQMTLGVTGAISRHEALAKLESAFGDWPPCPTELEPAEPLRIREEPSVCIVHRELEQSTIIMGHAGRVLRSDTEAFTASQLANHILGGAGLSSRLMERLRTDHGLAYTAWSTWGAGADQERLFGAFTQTRAEATAEAVSEMYTVIETFRSDPPTQSEVQDAIDNIVHGYVFAFENVADVVARQISYRVAGLDEDWFELYIDHVQRATPETLSDLVEDRLDPEALSIVIVGDTTRFELPDHLRTRIMSSPVEPSSCGGPTL